jgi:hypothetical protein
MLKRKGRCPAVACGKRGLKMSASFIKSRPWLLVVGYLCLQSVAVRAQNTSPVPPPGSPKEFRTLKEFKDMVASYFAPGTFKKPDGSTDDNRAEVLAIYLREIGEPPLLRSDNNLEPHAYRLHWTGFPAGKTLVVRLQIDSLGSAKVFAKSTPFNGTNLLLNKEEGVTVEGVDRFLECVERADFWHLPTVEQPEPQMPDGSYWYLEGSRHGEYHIVYRRNPELHPNPFTDIGRYLAKDLAQLPDSIISIPRADRSEPARRVAHP